MVSFHLFFKMNLLPLRSNAEYCHLVYNLIMCWHIFNYKAHYIFDIPPNVDVEKTFSEFHAHMYKMLFLLYFYLDFIQYQQQSLL